ncbi:hypothetical protein LQ327_22460 [Actinomycetospora endophytica]|uniref:Uncharacterized protein n=1 Tax=Actinomycetospora endophytica TaxID=2291215 RepID=A0ABS8PCY6_9PSEU|nr:hypothetical protein [Actinomycetospora endophytica]MCD2196139.1 hypothetical protein [Actinomycetospora endophytica]
MAQTFAAVIAPTTVITALLFYFGRLHAQALTRYFGVSFTVFDFTTQDYLVRSADGLFVPLTFAASLVLVSLVLRRGYLLLPPTVRDPVGAVLIPVLTVVGLGMLVVSLLIAWGSIAADSAPELGGLMLCAGSLALLWALRSWGRRTGPSLEGPASSPTTRGAEYVVGFVLVSVGLFWAINSYAIGVGTGRAEQIESDLGASPDLVLLSRGRLGMQAPGITETVCSDPGINPESSFRFRYTGLKYVLQSGNYYLLLPATWSHDSGPAFVVARSDSLQLQFYPPGQGVQLTC